MTRVKCVNPLCPRVLIVVKRPANAGGRSEYCSRECYGIWNPPLREVAFKMGARNPVELFHLLKKSISNVGLRTTALVIGTSVRQLSKWVDRLPGIYPEGYKKDECHTKR